ncbi:DJ-1/PfpI family protein [Sphingobacterium spiritivorum]|uniref:DJ-1/PfpI family protein n=1 Tax=Sphingobacterium spiritivorum TaxID=258 RepID=UPI003DA57070
MKELLGEPLIDIKKIGILVYEGAHTMEVIAPMAVFSEMMSVKIDYIATKKGDVQTTLATIEVSKALDDVEELDLLIVPGGNKQGLMETMANPKIIEWITTMDKQTKLSAGIGSGVYILAKGVGLAGKQLSLPWYKAEENASLINGKYSTERYIKDGKYYTCVGHTASIDMSLAMLGDIAGKPNLQGAMLDLEYDPQPPLEGGLPEFTKDSILNRAMLHHFEIDGLQFINDQKIQSSTDVVNIGILVYPDFFTLDAIGPLVVLSQLPNVHVELISTGDKSIKSGRTYFGVDKNIAGVNHLDVLLIPGGANGTWAVAQDQNILDWIKHIDISSRLTSSVCTGSWVLGEAGFLKGRRASTNWYRASQMMERYGAPFTGERYTVDGKYWTSAGVSAGIDMSFAMIQHFAGDDGTKHAMLNLAYHPQPPIEGGSPEKTDDLVLDMMHQMYDYLMTPLIKD